MHNFNYIFVNTAKIVYILENYFSVIIDSFLEIILFNFN